MQGSILSGLSIQCDNAFFYSENIDGIIQNILAKLPGKLYLAIIYLFPVIQNGVNC